MILAETADAISVHRNTRMDIYCDQRTGSHARVRFSAGNETEVSGSIRGPFCKYARTLPTTFSIEQQQAIVVDPCYWTPTMPFRYEVDLAITTARGSTQHQFLWGLRCCIPHRNNLRLDGKRFVVRAIEAKEENVDLCELRELGCGLMIGSPSARLCESASETGVMIIQTDQHTKKSMYEFNRQSAVHFSLGEPVEQTNIVRISHTSRSANTIRIIAKHDLPNEDMSRSGPIFVQCGTEDASAANMRRSCDWLQRDVARHGQFAGYLTSVDT